MSTTELFETEEEQVQLVKRGRYGETTQLPKKPVFTIKLPPDVAVGSNGDLKLSVGFEAVPRADVKWNVNGFELKDSKKVTVINEEDHSTLIVRSPVRYGRYSVAVSNDYGMCSQATRIHYDEDEQYEEIKESHSITNGVREQPMSASTTTSLLDGFELIDEQQRFGKSADSSETFRYVKNVRAATEGRETPTTRDETPTARCSFHSFMSNIQQREESRDGRRAVSYEASRIPPQPLPKSATPVIIGPQRGASVSIVFGESRVSPYREEQYEEVSSGVSRVKVTQPSLSPSKFAGSTVTDTLVEQKYEEATDGVPSPKPGLQNAIVDHEIMEAKTLRIPVRRVIQPVPKHPTILKQPEPEIRLKAGEKLVLESKVDSSPASQFKWYQNNFEVRPSSSVIIESPAVNQSRTTFLKPSSGTYRVVASNRHGSCASTTRVITEVTEEWIADPMISLVRVVPERLEPKYQLVNRSHNVIRDNLPKAPRIVEGFESVLRNLSHEPLALRVTADAIPEASFRWMLNNFEVRPNQAVTIERLGPNVSQATFHNPISGRYEVVATNSLGQDSCSTKVIVGYAPEAKVPSFQAMKRPTAPKVPVFIKPLPGETQLYSDRREFRLSVSVHGEQPITYRWFADGSLLSNSVEHQMINDLESSTLVVRKGIECDVDYAVEVSNANGAVWSETTVRPPSPSASLVTSSTSAESSEVNDIQRSSPLFTILLMDSELQLNDEFTAHVAVRAECSPCEFVWTLNGRDIRTIPGLRVESTCFKSTLHIKSAVAKHSGELSVLASNKYGTARSTAEILVNPC